MSGIKQLAVGAAALALAASLGASACGADDLSAQTSLPIRLRFERSKSKLVYSILVHFGGTPLEAVFDTGSIPTLVLKGRVPPRDARPNGQSYSVTYGGGRTYDSDIVEGRVRIGAASAKIDFGVVSSVHCTPPRSQCALSGEGPRDALFANLHPAIVGARITTGTAGLQTAFRELGVHRFIVTAPRLGESPGELRLDPNANEVSKFVPIAEANVGTGVPGGSVRGCLRDKTNGASFCGVVLFDTGRTGIEVVPASGNTQSVTWKAKDAGQLELTDSSGAEIAGVDFPVDADDPTKVSFKAPGPSTQAVIYAGQLPYIGLHILTDLDTSAYAVRARSKAPDGVVGHVP